MKTRLINILILLAASVLPTWATLDHYSNDHPVLFGMDRDYPPLEYIDEYGEPKGYDIEFTKELMSRLGLSLTYSPNKWENVADDVLNGRVDLAMMVYSPYRKDSTNYSRAVFRLYYQVLYRKESSERFDMRHLDGKSVAYMASRPIRDTLTHAGAILHEIENLSQAIVDLSNGKYDAVICFRYQSKFLINRYHITNVIAEDLTLTPREYCYVSHDRKLIEAINSELRKMEAEGRITAVYSDVYSSFDGFKIPNWVWILIGVIIIGFLMTFIVFQHRYQQKLRREMMRALRNEQMKTVFLGNVSHALRTPLNSIIGFSDLLKSEDASQLPDNERVKMLELINANGKQLLYFISEILELSELEGNELKFNRSVVRVGELMENYVHETLPKLKPGVELYLDCKMDGEVCVDVRLNHFVTMHFLENAAKYTEKGKITLSYEVRDSELYIEVRDTGCGVSESLRENIFGLLSDKATSIQSEIPGLGLTICRTIVERCGGKIGLQPLEDGSLFWHSVPIKVYKKYNYEKS